MTTTGQDGGEVSEETAGQAARVFYRAMLEPGTTHGVGIRAALAAVAPDLVRADRSLAAASPRLRHPRRGDRWATN